jgi:4-amino-4-deoxy-L-arabinose transferase-like glycosyltransferase
MTPRIFAWGAPLAVVALGLVLRLAGLADLGLGFDELQHIYAARAVLESGEPVLPSGWVYDRALLFTQMVAASMATFGDSAFAARLPSVGFGTATILLVFVAGRTFFGAGTGLLAAFLIATLPFELVWARTARMYAVYQFFSVLAGYAFYRGFEPEESARGPLTRAVERLRVGRLSTLNGQLGLEWLLVSLLALVTALQLHSLTGLLGLAVLAYGGFLAILVAFRDGPAAGLRSKYFVLSLIGVVTIALAAVTPGLGDEIVRQLQFRPDWVGDARAEPTFYLRMLHSGTFVPMGFFFLLGLVLVVTRADRAALFVAILAGVPLAFHSLLARTQSPRYVYDCFPWIVLLSCWAATTLFSLERDRIIDSARALLPGSTLAQRAAPAALGTLLIGCFLVLPSGIRNGTRNALRQGTTAGGQYNVAWGEACRFLSDRVEAEDVLIASIPLAADYEGCPKVSYNLDNGEIDQFLEGESARFPRHVFADTPAIVDLAGLEEVLASPRRYWLVTDTQRFGNDGNTPPDVRAHVLESFERLWTAADGTISIFATPSERPSGGAPH